MPTAPKQTLRLLLTAAVVFGISAGSLLAAGITWSTTGSMMQQRFNHTSTLLANGKVLTVGGGKNPDEKLTRTAEVYNVATGAWSAAGRLNVARLYHTAILLPNGQVLIVGGSGVKETALNSTELYSPATRTFTLTGNLNVARYGHATTLLDDGRVSSPAVSNPASARSRARKFTTRRPASGRSLAR